MSLFSEEVNILIVIRTATIDDAEQKGRVHYKTWKETYTGLMNSTYLDNMNVEKCINIARKYPENTLVADINNEIVGFACYGQCRDNGMEEYGEIIAVYVLKDYQKQGIGKMLMEACIKKLNCYDKICLWVLNTNHNAISFYKKLGFQFNGDEKHEILVTPIIELRMVNSINNISSL
jgi:ribosomal protein S18 acetylase RimI-like enzyme